MNKELQKINLKIAGSKFPLEVPREMEPRYRAAGRLVSEVHDRFIEQGYEPHSAPTLTAALLGNRYCQGRREWDMTGHRYRFGSAIERMWEVYRRIGYNDDPDRSAFIVALQFAFDIVERESPNGV